MPLLEPTTLIRLLSVRLDLLIKSEPEKIIVLNLGGGICIESGMIPANKEM